MSHTLVDERVMSSEETDMILEEICRELLAGDGKEWLSLKEISDITEKSPSFIDFLVSTGHIQKIREISHDDYSFTLIHRDMIPLIISSEEVADAHAGSDGTGSRDAARGSIPCEYYDLKLQEWMKERDRLIQGLMMYRYKFEEIEKQMKLLPAPPEIMQKKLSEREMQLMKAKKIIIRERAYTKDLVTQVEKKEGLLMNMQRYVRQEREEKYNLKSLLEDKETRLSQQMELLKEAHKVVQGQIESRESMTLRIREQEEEMARLQKRLEEEERSKSEIKIRLEKELEILQRPWWKKLFGMP